MKICINAIEFAFHHDGGQVVIIMTDVPAKKSIEVYLNKEEALTLSTAFKEFGNRLGKR